MNRDKILQATLLLTAFFNKREVGQIKPLTPLEYGRFALWLHQKGLSPADLLDEPDSILQNWIDPKKKITLERVNTLLARGASMGFALEHWQKHGVWILSRVNNEYPRSIREHLGDARPPILYGVGNKQLLNKPGIGFVGSRSIDVADEEFTKSLACLAVDQGFVVVSGGAKGIDKTSMASALEHGGECVGVLSDSLLRTSTSKLYREAIKEGRLALITPYYPEAGFSTGNAMGRNKYIYTLSKAVVAVKSDLNKGGTWAGAVENQKKGWVPLLVRDDPCEGNQALIQQGALAITDSFTDFYPLLSSSSGNKGSLSVPSQAQDAQETDLLTTMEGSTSHKSSMQNEQQLVEKQDDVSSDSGAEEPELLLDGGVETEAHQKQDSVLISETIPNPEKEPESEFVDSATFEVKTAQEGSVETESCDQSDRLSGTPLESYGEVFSVFFETVVSIEKVERCVAPSDLSESFPELPLSLVKKWLGELEKHGMLQRQGRKLSYTLPDHDLFTG